MLRLVEIGLFLLPFAVFLSWSRLVGGAGPSMPGLVAILAGLVVIGCALAWVGVHRRMPPDALYVPPHMQDGRIVAGHAAPR